MKLMRSMNRNEVVREAEQTNFHNEHIAGIKILMVHFFCA
jgi:hypothetical protein